MAIVYWGRGKAAADIFSLSKMLQFQACRHTSSADEDSSQLSPNIFSHNSFTDKAVVVVPEAVNHGEIDGSRFCSAAILEKML
ncbi:hypothetical protein CK203_032640 [Vitis vinifera]|uniref:Uncharacterized protein n=1 Tax=Vitis vinifera TaxID=29760 RepID=A0A438HXL4_VITVI|nr:hypothetical protein CK203_032640 [Vitis vinifera]